MNVAAIASYGIGYVIYPLVLVAGIVLCNRISYRGGLIFFALFLAKFGLSLLFSVYARISIHNTTEPPWGMSLGNFIATYTIVTNVVLNLITIAAFLILLQSLYKKFSKKSIT